MPRSLRTVVRLPGPLGGLAAHLNARQVGPLRCQDCENVIIRPGRLKKRPGIVKLDDTESPDDVLDVVTAARAEGVFGTITNPASGSPVELIVTKVSLVAGAYTTGKLRFWFDDNVGFQVQSNTEDPLGLNGNVPTFQKVGIRGADELANIYMLDGSDRAHRIPAHTSRTVYRAGLPPPTNMLLLDVVGGGTWTAVKHEFKIAICDRDQTQPDDPLNPPGLLSLATVESGLTTPDNNFSIDFDAPDKAVEPWTHLAVYVRSADVNPDQFLFLGYWNLDGKDRADDKGVIGAGSNGREWRITLGGTAGQQATGTGTYDFPPTRNNVPEKMRYFAIFNGRGFWARDNESFVWYSDPVSALTGGHYEALSYEFLQPLSTTITLLAAFRDQLVIGTSAGLHVLTGIISSHTNASAAREETLPPFSAQFEPVQGDIGPVAKGTGSFVVADNHLYFISKNGLERYDGQSVQDINLAIRSLLPTSDTTNTMATATLAHDPVKHIIYMLIREDVSGGKYLGDDAATTGQLDSTTWCYHYREVDRDTGYGQWTRITTIGSTTEALGNNQRYGAVGMRQPLGSESRLLVGMRAFNGDSPDIADDATVYEESASGFADDDLKGVSGVNVVWSWQSGRWNAGLNERRKRFHHLTTPIRKGSNSSGTFVVDYEIDGSASRVGTCPENQDRIESPLGAYGDDLSVKFSGASTEESEILSYAIDMEPVDAF